MIPYDDLVYALGNWRARQGLPPLHDLDYLGAPRQHRIDTSSAIPGQESPMAVDVAGADDSIQVDTGMLQLDDELEGADAAMAVDTGMLQLDEQLEDADAAMQIDTGMLAMDGEQGDDDAAMQVDTGMLQLDDEQAAHAMMDAGQVYEDPTAMPPAPPPGSYDQAVDPAQQAYDPAAYDDPSIPPMPPGSIETTHQPVLAPRQRFGEDGEESTMMVGHLAPASPQYPPTPYGDAPVPATDPMHQMQGHDSAVPNEPVYDSMAAAAEYHAEQDYASQQPQGMPTEGYGQAQPWPAQRADMPTEAYSEVPNYEAPPMPAADASTQAYNQIPGHQPPPLEPEPEEEAGDYSFQFNQGEEQ